MEGGWGQNGGGTETDLEWHRIRWEKFQSCRKLFFEDKLLSLSGEGGPDYPPMHGSLGRVLLSIPAFLITLVGHNRTLRMQTYAKIPHPYSPPLIILHFKATVVSWIAAN